MVGVLVRSALAVERWRTGCLAAKWCSRLHLRRGIHWPRSCRLQVSTSLVSPQQRQGVRTGCTLSEERHPMARAAGQQPSLDGSTKEPLLLPNGELFDRGRFTETLRLKAVKLPSRDCQNGLKRLAGFTLNKPRLKNVIHVPQEPAGPDRLVLLRPEAFEAGELKPAVRAFVLEAQYEVVDHALVLGYDYYGADQILRKLLPKGSEVPTAFETVGHIAHLNLREEFLPYKHVIGQVILDKNPKLETVVNKVGTIDNEFRVFTMELLAGKDKMETEVRQHGLCFKLDFSKVYWNSRLEREHELLVHSFKEGEVIADMMAGIGPFALPAANKGCVVLANDLNPDSVKWMRHNVKRNRLQGRISCFNLCGREFIRRLVAGDLQAAAVEDSETSCATSAGLRSAQNERKELKAPVDLPTYFSHAVMNLPASALEFLDVFTGLLTPVRHTWGGRPLPYIHCYGFARGSEGEEDLDEVILRAETAMGMRMGKDYNIRLVRNVVRQLTILYRSGNALRADASVANFRLQTRL
mmetsp:Transcript_9337/g.34237  ORF Transcript_9337/g.34237 Transcript_9337/m.34237 type:complete len:525 (-) Transcript_9337:1175-2749(-)